MLRSRSAKDRTDRCCRHSSSRRVLFAWIARTSSCCGHRPAQSTKIAFNLTQVADFIGELHGPVAASHTCCITDCNIIITICNICQEDSSDMAYASLERVLVRRIPPPIAFGWDRFTHRSSSSSVIVARYADARTTFKNRFSVDQTNVIRATKESIESAANQNHPPRHRGLVVRYHALCGRQCEPLPPPEPDQVVGEIADSLTL